jgi:predicted mannosyl-3-phosphoglycerate phosphatase (HAD superfamily)
MMNSDTVARAETKPVPTSVPQPSVVVVTTVDGTLQDQHIGWYPQARAALDLLTEQGVPVVLWSADDAGEVIGLQSEAGLRHPFVCRRGAELYIPNLYFPEPVGLGREEGPWTVLDRARPPRSIASAALEPAQAIRLLIGLYRVYSDDVLIVGVGSEWPDRDLLHEVDVPVVVRRGDRDQARLVRRFPDAYVTRACGPDGWREAILGAGEDT